MAVNILFLDNETYGAADVNKAFSRLTTQGVSLFNDAGAPLTDLNTAVSNLVESGVELYNMDACKVINNEGTYQIMPGTAWMADGSCITISDEPYHLDVTSGAEQHVYFQRNIGMNTIDIVVSGTNPPEDALLIAKISAGGVVTDKRTFAVTKVAPVTANIVKEIDAPKIAVDSSYRSVKIDTGFAAYSHVQIVHAQKLNLTNGSVDLGHEFITLENGAEITFKAFGVNTGESNQRRCWIKLKKDGKLLTLSVKNDYSMDGDTIFKVVAY